MISNSISDIKNGTGRTLRINPAALEALREIAPLPDLDGLDLVIEPAPAPRIWLTALKVAISMSAAAVFALWIGVSASTSYLDATRETPAPPGGGGNGLMTDGGNGLTGATYPSTVFPPSRNDSAPPAPSIRSSGSAAGTGVSR
jgi:hypothetical protein